MAQLYDFREYDRHLCLKLNVGLWLVIVYLFRPFIALVSAVEMGPGGGGRQGVDYFKRLLYPDDFSLALGIIATLPALLFILALMRRKPGAGNAIRALWHRSAWLLALSALLNAGIVFVPLLTGVISHLHLAGWIQIVIALAIIVYLFTSRRVSDTFADFPAEGGKS